jgi:hypothetical protein
MKCNGLDREKVSCKESVASTTRRRVELLALSEGWSVGAAIHVCNECRQRPFKKADDETERIFGDF